MANLQSDAVAKEELMFNPELVRMARKWMQDVLGSEYASSSPSSPSSSSNPFIQSLKSGVLLCK